jgi:hypothetical protein
MSIAARPLRGKWEKFTSDTSLRTARLARRLAGHELAKLRARDWELEDWELEDWELEDWELED